MFLNHNLEMFLDAWLDTWACRTTDVPLFPTLRHRKLTGRQPLGLAEVQMMIQRRARAAELRGWLA